MGRLLLIQDRESVLLFKFLFWDIYGVLPVNQRLKGGGSCLSIRLGLYRVWLSVAATKVSIYVIVSTGTGAIF